MGDFFSPLSQKGGVGGGIKIMQTHLKRYQRENRNNMPQPELRLWYYIRKEQLGVKFRRQYVIDNRILDFYSPQIKLGIELDGDSHFVDTLGQQEEMFSDKALEENNIKILRFTNADIKESLEGVVSKIQSEIVKRK